MKKTQFNILEYGAIGDGVYDCTKAIQTALDLAAECNGEVIVPPGVYQTGTLKMGPHTKLSGVSTWTFGDYGGSIFQLNDESANYLLDISGAFGCHIQGMNLCGKRLGKDIHGIYLYWPVYNGGESEDTPTIDDCKIGDFSGDGLHFEHIWCFSIRHSQFFRNQGAGLYLDGWDGFILDNWFSANGNCGILGGPMVASITVTGNRIEWNRYAGIAIQKGNSFNITGNFFDRSFGPGLKFGYHGTIVEDATITGNIFRRSGKPEEGCIKTAYDSSHIHLDGVLNTVITGNTFRYGRDDLAKGTFSPNYSIVAENSNYIIIKDNIMNGGALEENIISDNKGHNLIENNLGQTVSNPSYN